MPQAQKVLIAALCAQKHPNYLVVQNLQTEPS